MKHPNSSCEYHILFDKLAKCWIDITDLAKPTYLINP